MKSDIQTVQDIPIELHPFSVSAYGDRYVVKNRDAKTFIFIDEEELGWLEALKTPTSMANLIQMYHRKTGKYSYKKVFEFITLLLSASFLTPKCQSALTASELFKPFAPPPPPKLLAPIVFSSPDWLAKLLAKIMDNWVVIGILACFTIFGTYRMFAHADDFEWLSLDGRFTYGLAVWIISLASIFFLKNIFKSLMLTGKELDVSGSGIRLEWGIPKYIVKDSDILTLGPDRTLRFHMASLLFPSVLSFVGVLIFRHTHAGFWGIWSLAGLLVIFLDLSPFVQREFMNVMDRLSGKNRLLETLKNFVHRKFVGRIFSFGQTYRVEARLIGYAIYLYSVLWLFGAYLISTAVLHQNLRPLTRTFIFSESNVELAAAWALVIGLLMPFVGLINGVLRFVALNIYTLFEKPLNRVLNDLSHLFRRFHVVPRSEVPGFLSRIPLYAQMSPDVRAKLAEYVRVQHFRPWRTVVWQGKPGDAFYTIYRGEADVFREESNGDQAHLATLTAQDSFGEIALIKDEPRTATVKARTALTCLVLPKDVFKEFIESSHEDKEEITRLIQWNGLLKTLPIFVDLPAETIARVIHEMTERQVAKGDAIVHQGDPAQEFYILRAGSAEVWRDHGKPTAQNIATLHAGQYFGEIALFEDTPRTATIVALEPCRILVMPKDAFFRVLRSSVLSGIWIEQTSRMRRQEMMARS